MSWFKKITLNQVLGVVGTIGGAALGIGLAAKTGGASIAAGIGPPMAPINVSGPSSPATTTAPRPNILQTIFGAVGSIFGGQQQQQQQQPVQPLAVSQPQPVHSSIQPRGEIKPTYVVIGLGVIGLFIYLFKSKRR